MLSVPLFKRTVILIIIKNHVCGHRMHNLHPNIVRSYNFNVRLASGTAFCSGSKCTFSSGASYVLLMALLLVVVVKDFGTKWL